MPTHFEFSLDLLARSGFMWGPFFFSLLFMLFITRKAHIYYQSIIKRTEPPAEVSEKTVYKNYFFASFISGIFLVFISVGWWVYAQLQLHAYEGVIVGLEKHQEIYPINGDVYLKKVQREFGSSGQKTNEYHFAIIRDKPFNSGQVFEFGFDQARGGHGDIPEKPIIVKVHFSGEASERFQIAANANGVFNLKKIDN